MAETHAQTFERYAVEHEARAALHRKQGNQSAAVEQDEQARLWREARDRALADPSAYGDPL